MPVLLTCPRGHQWQSSGQEFGDKSVPRECPICGAPSHDPRAPIAATLDFQIDPIQSPAVPFVPAQGAPGLALPAGTNPVSSDAVTIPRTAKDTSSEDGPALSQRIPGYEIVGELGRGGMGVVYKARQISLNRIVALKMILAGASADAPQLARFRAEAEAVARLQHANIVQIYEISEHENCPFFSLEYVDGGTLAQKLNGGPQPPRLAAHVVALVAHAIHYAHQRGIIHRDLKPGNILLATLSEHPSSADAFRAEMQSALRLYGVPKITDFGLAKHLGDGQAQTRTGAILGTPSYMAPEQAEGRSHAIGPATDVYALGSILYEMLTGKPPFESDSSLDTIRQLLSSDPVRPSHLQLKVPRDLETICLKCLEKNPARRYASAEDLAEDLERFLQSKPIEARPIGRMGRTIRWMRRHPTWTALFLVVSLASLTLLSIGLAYHVRLRGAVDESRRNAEESRKNLVRLHVAQGTSAMNDGDGFTALLWFTEALRLDPGSREYEEAHRERIAALVHSLPKLVQVWVHEGAVNEARFSPDGRRVLTAGDDGKAHLWDSETGKMTAAPLIHAGPVVRAVFSPDGNRVATASQDGTARVWDAATGQPITPPLRHDVPVSWIVFRPDGRQVATAGADDAARVWEVPSGKLLSAERKHAGRVHQAHFSPDGRWLATAGDDGFVRIWDADKRHPAPIVLPHDGAVLCLAFSSDSKLIATGGADHAARVWDVQTGAPVGQTMRHRDTITCVEFSPFGRRLLTSSEDGTARVWRVTDGERLVEPLRHKSAIHSAVFSSDGCRVATAGDDNVARVWSAINGAPLTPPLRYNGTVNHATFSPDCRRLVTASDDGTTRVWGITCRPLGRALDEEAIFRRQVDRQLGVGEAPADATAAARSFTSPDGKRVVKIGKDNTARVWDAATGAPISPPLRHASAVGFADFSPDGRRVATASEDNTARIWDVEMGELLVRPLRHDGTVTQAVFSAEGGRVATGSLDRTARVWDVSTGQALTPPLQHPWPVKRVRFAPGGKQLLTTGPDGGLWTWDLPSSACVTGDLVHLAQLFSGSRIDPSRGVMPVEPRDLQAMWSDLRDSRRDLFHFSSDDVTAWHCGSAEECARGRSWDAAIWHLNKLTEIKPDYWLPYARRGVARAELGRWAEASADFSEAIKRAPGETEVSCLRALLCLQTGDLAGYRRACADLMKRLGKSHDRRVDYRTAWIGVLRANVEGEPSRLVELAERALAQRPRDPDYLTTLGAALCRAGDLDGATRKLHAALTLRGGRPGPREWLWLTVVHHRKGMPGEARRWLDKANSWLAARTPARDGRQSASLPWAQEIQLRLLLREAEQLLKSDKSDGK